jgi:hypothetical protein
VPRDRDSEANAEADAEADAEETDTETDVETDVETDAEADAETARDGVPTGIVGLAWDSCFRCLNRVEYSFSALFDSSMMSTDEVYEVISQLAWWLLRKNYLKVLLVEFRGVGKKYG